MSENIDEKIYGSAESKEALAGREIELYLFRHAEAFDQGQDAELTELGKEQAGSAAQDLLKQIIEQGGGIIKFLFSPVKRAKQTSEIMQQAIQGALSEQHLDNIKLMSPRDNEALKSAGVVGPLKERGIDDPANYWLQNPEALAGKSPSETAEKLQGLIDSLQKMADRLPSGERIYYIGITHEIPQSALLHKISGKTPAEFGGNLKNCESIRVVLKGKSDEDAVINFRGEEMKLTAQNEK